MVPRLHIRKLRHREVRLALRQPVKASARALIQYSSEKHRPQGEVKVPQAGRCMEGVLREAETERRLGYVRKRGCLGEVEPTSAKALRGERG